MICYKDSTWCSKSITCGTTECDRKFTKEEQEKAIIWWGSEDFPVAMSDFSDTCGRFEYGKLNEKGLK